MATTSKEVSLRLLVDEKKNKVLYVQAGNEFVDVLLSFLTLPLGTIARLVGAAESNGEKVCVGSLSSLYESVADLDENQFWTLTCKEMLLQPRNSMEDYCRKLKLNIDDTEKTKFFICDDWECSRQYSGGLLSKFKNQRCKCGKLMNREIFHQHSADIGDKGLVPEMTTFIISDDLNVKPDNAGTSVFLPTNLGCEDFDALKQVTLNITRKEIVELLKCSLLSSTTLTDVFLLKKQFTVNAQRFRALDLDDAEVPYGGAGKTMEIKVMWRKSDNKVLFALGDEGFVDFVLSFLTFPLGNVEHLLNGKSYSSSIDNLYRSLLQLDHRYLLSSELKDKLVKPQVAHQFKLRYQIFPIDEVRAPYYSCFSEYNNIFELSGYLNQTLRGYYKKGRKSCAPLSYLEPQSSTGKAYSDGGRGFVKGPTLYMVTDNLAITPCSSLSTISLLTKLKIPTSDLEETTLTIGKKEGLSILRASLVSSSALTNGLGPFLKPAVTVKKENSPN